MEDEKDPRRKILLISGLIEIGVFAGIYLLFLLPSIISIVSLPTILPTTPSLSRILVGVILGIVGIVFGSVAFKKGLWRRIFLVLVLLGVLVATGLLTLPTISLTTPPLWTVLAGGIVGIAVMVVVGFLLIYWWWAPNNLFFTFVPEGRAKVVVRGDAIRKVLIQWEGHVLTDARDVTERPTRKRFLGGLRWYGFWPFDDIYIYDFSWTNVRQNGEIQIHEKETLDYILLKDDTYWAKVEKAEDQKLLPLDIELVLTIRVLNPYKALFQVENWLETVINRTEPAVRDRITEDTYENWIVKPKDLADRIVSDLETKELLREFKERYGVDLRAIEVRAIDPGKEYRDATVAKYLAEKEKDKILVQAEAERERIKKVAQGETQRIKKVYAQVQEFGDLGKLVRILEAMEKSPGEGAKWVIPLPGMTELLSQVFPGRKVESLKPEDVRTLREIIEKFNEFKENNKRKKVS